MTSRPTRRQLLWLSQRLVRLALLASATSLLSYASPAWAQLPIVGAERDPELEPPLPAPPALPPTGPGSPPAPAPTPAPPSGVGTTPHSSAPADTRSGPQPAKADVLTTPDPRPEAEARADERDSDPREPAEVARRRRWYGWQTLTADGISFAALFAGAALSGSTGDASDGRELAWFGILGYALAPGFVHFGHRSPGRGFASFGLRLAMPLAGAFIGASLASGCDTILCEANGAGTGILLGMGGAIAIDAAVLAYDEPKRSSARHLALVPLVSVAPHQAWLGVGGQL